MNARIKYDPAYGKPFTMAEYEARKAAKLVKQSAPAATPATNPKTTPITKTDS